MKHIKFAFAIAAAAGLLAFGITQEAPRGRVEGTLIMAENGKPLPKVRVTLLRTNVDASQLDEDEKDELSVRADDRGKFAFPGVTTGQYTLEVSARNHTANKVTINVTEGQPYSTEIKLYPEEENLTASVSQQNWLPTETPSFELDGFTSRKSVKLEVYRLEQTGTAGSLTRNEILYGPNGSWPYPNAHKIREIDYVPVNRDVEGRFIDQVKLDGLAEGMYVVQVLGEKTYQRAFLNVTKLSLVTRSDRNRVLCFVADLVSGKPIPGAEIYGTVDHQKSLLGKTDGDGIFTVANDRSRTFTAVSGASTALLDTNPNDSRTQGAISLVTDRPVYRPGDTVQYRGIVRQLKGKDYALPPQGQATVRISDGNGNLVTTQTAEIDAHGCFHSSWESSSESKPGYYSFELTAAGIHASKGVTIASYRKPEFSIDVNSVQKRYVMGEVGDATIRATYYYGAPVVGAKVEVNVYRSPKWDVVAPWDIADDNDYGDVSPFGEWVEQRQIITDESGVAHLKLPLRQHVEDKEAPRKTSPDDAYEDLQDYTYQLDVVVSDASGKTAQGRGDFDVNQGDYRIFAQTRQYVSEKGKPVDLDIATSKVDDSSMSVPNRPVKIEVLKERYDKREVHFELLDTLTAQTDGSGQAHVSVPIQKRGSIRLRVTSIDDRGHTVSTLAYIYSESPGEAIPTDDDSTKLTVSLDKKTYKVGDVAKVLFQGPDAAGASALVCSEAEHMLTHKVVPIKGSSTTVEIPVTEEMAPNGFVSVVLVKDKKFTEVTRKINLDWTSRDLRIELGTDASKYSPGATVQVKVKTTDSSGRPIPASLSLGCVDESIFAIRKDLLKIRNDFYPKQYDGVQTQHSFEEIYLDGGDKSPARMTVRRNFKDTAAWMPSLVTDANGHGVATIRLPDNLTTWRLTAVGVSDRTDVGQTTLSFRTWKPLMVRLDCPTYLVNEDRQQVTVGITNDTDKDADVKVSLTASNGRLEGLDAGLHHIPAGKQVDLPVTFLAGQTGMAKILASAETSGANDAVEKSFKIVPRGELKVQSTSFELGEKVESHFVIQPDSDPNFGDLKLRLESSVAGSALSALDGLIDYPYGCVEQTVDRFVPSLIVSKLVEDLKLPAPSRIGEVPKIARDGLTRLAAMQHSDGGWGWWQYDASNPLMTCLVLDGLQQAKAMGYTSTQIRESDAWSWLAKVASTEIRAKGDAQLMGYEWLAVGATLAEHGSNDAARKALEHFDRQLAGPAEWSFAARAFHALGDGPRTQEAIDALRQTAQSQDGATHWLAQGWTGQEENTGFALEALTLVSPQDPLIPQTVRYFMRNRDAGGWSTTLATAKVLRSLDRYIRSTGKSVSPATFEVRLDGKLLKTVELDPSKTDPTLTVPRSELKEGSHDLVIQRIGGAVQSGASYYVVSLRQYGSAPVAKAVSDEPGLTVERAYRLLRPGRNSSGALELIPSTQPISSAQSGDVIECEITVTNDKPREFMFLEDPIPSNCHVTEQTDLEDGTEWSYWYSGMQVLDDRVGVFARQLPAGKSQIVYHMRAETAGVSHALPTQLNGMYSPGRGSLSAEGPMEVLR